MNLEGDTMPHYGLINTIQTTTAEDALFCARLHLQSSKRRLEKGLLAAGLTSLYDALLFGMRYYIAKHESCASFLKNTDLWDANSLFHALTRAGVFEDPLTFNRFSLIVERALWQGSFSSDANAILTEVEKLLTKLGVMPESAPQHKSLAAH
jgi:hypothetical protein